MLRCVSDFSHRRGFLWRFFAGAVVLYCHQHHQQYLLCICQSAKALPGDVLELHCEIVTRRGPLGIGQATAYVDGKVAVTAELTFAVEV